MKSNIINNKPPSNSGAKLNKIMYRGKRKIFDTEKYEQHRKIDVSYKNGAIDVAFNELEGIIDGKVFAEQYFNQTEEWFAGRLEACTLLREGKFTSDECHELAEAFRDIAKRLNAHADEIDAAKMD